jgi:cell division initiation protein
MRTDKVVSEVLGEESAITPSDLYNTEFKSAIMGGYDKNEVDAFLERVADAYEAVLTQLRILRERNEEQKAQLDAYLEMEHTLRDALITAQKFSEDALDGARREADALIEQARLTKARAEHEAGRLSEALQAEIRTLRDERGRLRADLEAILETHRRLVENIPAAEDRVTVEPSVVSGDRSDGPDGDIRPGEMVEEEEPEETL